MDKLLIVGIDTLAGSNIAVTLASRCEIVGLNLDRNSAHKQIAAEQPNWIVYCGPTSRSSWDWSNAFDSAQEANHVAEVAEAARACGSRLTLISTDAVFNGPNLFHRETSSLAMDGSKALAARRVELALGVTESLIIRTHLFGWSPSSDSCAEQIWTALADGRTTHTGGEKYASPILASDMAELLWQGHRKGLTGVYHLAGAERISMWRFAARLAAASGAATNSLSTRLKATSDAEDRPIAEETSLDSRNIQRLLQSPLPMLRDCLDRFIEQAASGYRDRIIKTSEHSPRQLVGDLRSSAA